MDIVLWLFLGLLITGGGLAFYEWRRKRDVLRHDLSLDKQTQDRVTQAEIDAEAQRQMVNDFRGSH